MKPEISTGSIGSVYELLLLRQLNILHMKQEINNGSIG